MSKLTGYGSVKDKYGKEIKFENRINDAVFFQAVYELGNRGVIKGITNYRIPNQSLKYNLMDRYTEHDEFPHNALAIAENVSIQTTSFLRNVFKVTGVAVGVADGVAYGGGFGNYCYNDIPTGTSNREWLNGFEQIISNTNGIGLGTYFYFRPTNTFIGVRNNVLQKFKYNEITGECSDYEVIHTFPSGTTMQVCSDYKDTLFILRAGVMWVLDCYTETFTEVMTSSSINLSYIAKYDALYDDTNFKYISRDGVHLGTLVDRTGNILYSNEEIYIVANRVYRESLDTIESLGIVASTGIRDRANLYDDEDFSTMCIVTSSNMEFRHFSKPRFHLTQFPLYEPMNIEVGGEYEFEYYFQWRDII